MVQGADVVRINGRVYTRTNAIARGLISKEPYGTAEVLPDPAEAPPGPAVLTRAQKAVATRAANLAAKLAVIVEPAEDGDKPVRKSKGIEPLRPQNVDHEGKPVTDEETLAKIATETHLVVAGEIVKFIIPAAGEEEE